MQQIPMNHHALPSTTSTRTPLELRPMRFGCAFIHYECPHDAIFKPLYLRTNRTNHTKILRCFPHCCPGHRQRSYCGSPLFVHVEIIDSLHSAQGIPGDEVVVFARFRPDDAKPLVIGQRIALKTIEQSLQNDDPSNGEWIGSSRASSTALTTSWIFKVNPSGRWFYPWSGAATIAMRATEHTLEVVAFRRVNDAELELIALTASPPFRLMSFRRGATSTEAITASSSSRRTTSPPYKRRSTYMQHYRRDLEQLSDHHSNLQKMDRRRDSESTSRGDDSQTQATLEPPRPHTVVETDGPSPEANTMASLLSWLQEIPASTVGSRWMLQWEKIVQHACEAHVLAARTSRGNARAGLVPILSALSLSKPSVVAASSSSTTPLQTSPLDIVDVVVRLLLHMWLDVDCCRASIAAINRCLDQSCDRNKAAVAAAHYAWLQGVHKRAQRFIYEDARVSWVHLQALRVSNQQEQVVNQLGDEFSLRAFAARCREGLIRSTPAENRRSKPSQHVLKRQRTTVDALPTRLLSSSVWRCRVEDVAIELDGVNHHAPSLLTVVEFWKHLGCLRLDFSPASSTSASEPAQLSVASVFNAQVNNGCFTKLTLDGQYRWFNCLPSGESTIGTALMGYVVGDYIGRATSAGSIHITTYLWPATAESSTAFAWHWTLDAASLSGGSGNSSVVSVVVESASVGRTPHAMETLSMAEKLRYVGRWQHTCQVRLGYNC